MVELKSPNGLTLFSAKPNFTFCESLAKFGHLSLMCFQLVEFGTHQIRPFELAPSLCQVNNFAKDLHLYMHNNHGIKGKCQSTFTRISCKPFNKSTNATIWTLLHIK
jgi:hypothetical protein